MNYESTEGESDWGEWVEVTLLTFHFPYGLTFAEIKGLCGCITASFNDIMNNYEVNGSFLIMKDADSNTVSMYYPSGGEPLAIGKILSDGCTVQFDLCQISLADSRMFGKVYY